MDKQAECVIFAAPAMPLLPAPRRALFLLARPVE